MRREVALCAALAALAAPTQASAQVSCTVPKGWSTSAAQLQYDLAKETGLAAMRVQRYIPPPGSTVDTGAFVRRLPVNAVDLATGSAESGLYTAAAVATFGARFATATVSEPPQCTITP